IPEKQRDRHNRDHAGDGVAGQAVRRSPSAITGYTGNWLAPAGAPPPGGRGAGRAAFGVYSAEPRAHRVQRGVRENEEGATILPAEDQVERTLGYRDGIDRSSRRVVHEHLPGGEIDSPFAILGEALATLLREYPQAGKSPIRIHAAAVSSLLRFVGDVKWLAGNGFHQAERLQNIGELLSEVWRPLNKGIFARDEHRAIRRNVLVGLPGGYDLGEHLVQRNIFVSRGLVSPGRKRIGEIAVHPVVHG